MDEEDLQEAEESRTLNMSNDFAGFGTEHDSMRKTAAMDIFRPLEETVGSRLLKRMGWREGQGIGPRVKRAAKLDDTEDASAKKHLFAPDDVQVVSLTRKTDMKGLGYAGESRPANDTVSPKHRGRQSAAFPDELSDDESGMRLGRSKTTALTPRRTGIGVGVLNDNGSDDEDPYSMGPKISYNKTLGGDKKTKSKPKTISSSANPLLKTKPTFISRKLASVKETLRKCHDGRLPLDGFVLDDQLDAFGTLTIQADQYKPPEVPPGWKSSVSRDEQIEAESKFVSTADAAKASNLTAKSRAALLGESQLPGKSVFDFLTPAAHHRLAAASGREDLPAAGSEPPPPGFETSATAPASLRSLVPHLDANVALQALNRELSGWMPYAEDENKRSRYRTYLEVQSGLREAEGDDNLPPRAEGMSRDDWVLEMQEFARAAELFKPVSGLMASRFTSSSSLPQSEKADSGADSLLSKPMAKPEDPALSAAKLGMFGPMTRSVISFHPSRLLCKRFSVPVPEEIALGGYGQSGSTAPRARDTGSGTADVRASTGAVVLRDDAPNPPRLEEIRTDHGSRLEIVEQLQRAPMDPERNEALEAEKPGEAVFKAIFGSDDEDD